MTTVGKESLWRYFPTATNIMIVFITTATKVKKPFNHYTSHVT